MCNAFKWSVYLAMSYSCFLGLRAQELHSILKNCTGQGECPDHAVCTRVGGNFSCVCWQGYVQNHDWSIGAFDSSDSDYCAQGIANKTVTLYKRAPAKGEHLAIGILLVLFGVIVVILVIYCFVALRPIGRTQAAYRRLQLRRANHHQLEEFDEIDMTFSDLRSAQQLS